MRRCAAKLAQPTLTVKNQGLCQGLRASGTAVQCLREPNQNLQRENRLQAGQSLKRDPASQRPNEESIRYLA